jgi:iron complex transport system permease protein
LKTAAAKLTALALGTAALFVALFFTGLFAGSVAVPPAQALRAMAGLEPDSPAARIILGIRLPRIVMAVLIGMMLAAAGTVSQAVFRNPLADPYIIGISSGAVAGASLAFVLGLSDIWYGQLAIDKLISFTGTGAAVSPKFFSLGNMLEKLAVNIAELFYNV